MPAFDISFDLDFDSFDMSFDADFFWLNWDDENPSNDDIDIEFGDDDDDLEDSVEDEFTDDDWYDDDDPLSEDDDIVGDIGDDDIFCGQGDDSAEGGTGEDELYGDDGMDDLYGGYGDDWLSGGADDDDLYGEQGHDILVGGEGDDDLWGGTGNDDYIITDALDTVHEDAGEGVDTIFATVNINLWMNIENLALSGDALRGFGNALNNCLKGNGRNNVLSGMTGADDLFGGQGNDSLIGGGGNDSLVGGSGVDTLVGGDGRDQFVFAARHECGDLIQGFSVVHDTILVSRSLGGRMQMGAITADQFCQGSRASDRSDRFIYNENNGGLFFDADGSGASRPFKVAQLSVNLNLTYRDITITA